MRLTRTVTILGSLLLGSNASATVLCSYAAYTPSSIRYFLDREFMNQGFAIVPASIFGGPDANPNASYVIRDSQVFGSLVLNSDTAAGTTFLTFRGSSGEIIGAANETVYACSTGLCRRSTLSLGIGGTTSTLGISEDSGSGVRYFVMTNGEEDELGVTIWRSEFEEHILRITTQLMNSSRGVWLIAPTRIQQLAYLLLSDPVIFPYMGMLSLYQDDAGQTILSGRTNYSIYNLIISKALAAGVFIRPRVVIDSDIVIFPPSAPEDLQRCL